MREIKFKFWDSAKKQMLADYRDAQIWNGCLVCEGDIIPLQYTGMKDVLGVEIYEGDVLISTLGTRRAVIFYQGEYQTAFKLSSKSGQLTDNGLCNAIHLKVIGNIHESPELLK